MAQAQRNDLLFTSGNFLPSLAGVLVAATTTFIRIVCQLSPGVFPLIRLANAPQRQLMVAN
jgi:hypothetical protein